VRAYIEGIAACQDEETARRLRDVLDPEASDDAIASLPVGPGFVRRLKAMLRNTVSPTIISAGRQINVIPSEATACIDGRTVPGATDESFLAEIQPYLGEKVEVEVLQYSTALEASTDSPLYRTIERVMAEHDSDAAVVPLLSTGATDAKHIITRHPDTQIYGFIPAREDPDPTARDLLHAHDERVSVENLLFGTHVLYNIVCGFGTNVGMLED
jgi:acetylornithine deacetylase/succinyl-diaminopimelate desuccinylase-like protein